MTPGGSSRKGCFMAERLSRRYEVWIISRDVADRETLARHFGTPLANVNFHSISAESSHNSALTNLVLRRVPAHVRDILSQVPSYRRIRAMKLDLFILNSSSYAMRSPAPRGLFMCMFPWPLPTFPRARWCHWPIVKPIVKRLLANTLRRNPSAVPSYDVITANSQFTAEWIRKRWNREARVVYSASGTSAAIDGVIKSKIILSVGRYNWDKQQGVLIEAFREMHDAHSSGWELHFAGKVHNESVPYHEQLKAQAAGLPITFHHDVSSEELRALYSRSSIFWLAKGFQIPDAEPEKMEHFGNTPLEAMAAGSVPVVFDGGGLRETVQHEVNGYRWRTVQELRAFTTQLTHDDKLRESLSQRARIIDARFGVEPFLDAVEVIVEGMLTN